MNKCLLSWLVVMVLAVVSGAPLAAEERPTVRVGIVQFGTVAWELQTMRGLGLDEAHGVRVEVVPYALNDATRVALLGGAVDVIVGDWMWVARQRSQARDFVFEPYSLAVGSVMVRPDAGVATLADLKGRRLGVAGGAMDKSWLLLRAYARRTLGADAAQWVQPSFAAPPLLNELMLRGELPAVLNFWHFNARLAAAGMRELLTIDELLAALGVVEPVPMIGWVFSERWAQSNRSAIDGFLRASRAAKQVLRESDDAWQALRPTMRVDDEATFRALRDGFRAGIPDPARRGEAAAHAVFAILAAEGGRDLVGNARELAPGTFWTGSSAR